MITQSGFSKDESIPPTGIAITFGKEMIFEQGGLRKFLKGFIQSLEGSDGCWCHKMAKQPTKEIIFVYIIICNRLVYKCNYACYQHFNFEGYDAKGDPKYIDWPGVLISGPLIRCPFKRVLKGFQGFRYTTELF